MLDIVDISMYIKFPVVVQICNNKHMHELN